MPQCWLKSINHYQQNQQWFSVVLVSVQNLNLHDLCMRYVCGIYNSYIGVSSKFKIRHFHAGASSAKENDAILKPTSAY